MHGRREGWMAYSLGCRAVSHRQTANTWQGRKACPQRRSAHPIQFQKSPMPYDESHSHIHPPPSWTLHRSAMANRPSLSFSTTDPDPPLGNNYSASSQLAHKSHTLFCFATHFLFLPFFSLHLFFYTPQIRFFQNDAVVI